MFVFNPSILDRAQQSEKIVNVETIAGWTDTNLITRQTTKTHQIRWTIENISKVALDTILDGTDFHLTPSFTARIAFYKNKDHLYVYVCSKSDSEIKIERKIILFDCNNRKLHEENDTKIFTLEKDKNVDMLGKVPNRSRFDALPNDTLIIDLSISIKGEMMTEVCHFQCVIDPQKKLINDIKAMHETSINSDVSLQIDDELIPAHWSILCSRSPYFKKMFESEMMERVENSITVTDLSMGTLKKLIQFLYTADFGEDEEYDLEELFSLYYAADKYEVLDMRAICGFKIMSKATADNICQIFQFFHLHNDQDLKLQALKFIQFHSDEVLQTDGYKKFSSSEPVMAELITFCLKKQ